MTHLDIYIIAALRAIIFPTEEHKTSYTKMGMSLKIFNILTAVNSTNEERKLTQIQMAIEIVCPKGNAALRSGSNHCIYFSCS